MILRNGKNLITCDQERSTVKTRNKIDGKENKKERVVVKKRKHVDAEEEQSSKERLIVRKGKKVNHKKINKESATDDDLPPPPCKDLPEELVIESVLTRLSARTLGVCSCVNKLWYNTIYHDTRFATSHFVQNQNKFSLFFSLLNFRTRNIKKAFIFGLEKKDKGDLDLMHVAALNSECRNELVGYCNGLVCFEVVREDLTSSTEGAVIVLNPTRGETLCLPYLLPPGEYIHLCHGLGFDSSSQEYKIVVVFTSKASDEFVSKVITLGSRSWKNITTAAADISLPPGFRIPSRMVTRVSRSSASSTLCEGNLIWKITNEVFEEDTNSSNKIEMLLSFDISSEKFKFIGLPTESSRVNEFPFFTEDHLLEFQGYPCVARFEKILTTNDDHRCRYPSRLCCCCGCCCKVQLYILKDKVMQVWSKWESFDIQFNKEGLPTSRFGCYFQSSPPRILSCSNQVLLYWFNGECLVLYNLQAKKLQVVKGSRSYPHVFPMLNESSVLGYLDPSYSWSIESRSKENKLHAQVENIRSLKAFIPKGEIIQSRCQDDFIQLVANKSPVGWLMTTRPSVNYFTFF